MNKKIILIIFILLFILFLINFNNLNFNTDTIWKIEEQRREHTYIFPQIAGLIHNKGIYIFFTVIENYLTYFSPATFFKYFQSIFAIIILVSFYCSFFILLKSNSKFLRLILIWVLLYPLFPAIMFLEPSLLLLQPLIFSSISLTAFAFYRKIKN